LKEEVGQTIASRRLPPCAPIFGSIDPACCRLLLYIQQIFPHFRNDRSENRRADVNFGRRLLDVIDHQGEDAVLKQRLARTAAAPAENERKIAAELLTAQGKAVDIGGYYFPDDAKCSAAMRPSATLNETIERMCLARAGRASPLRQRARGISARRNVRTASLGQALATKE
jgi:hypothetical protein